MAVKPRHTIVKLSKPPKNRASLKVKRRKIVSLVKRSPKRSDNTLHNRLAQLTNGTETIKVSRLTESKVAHKKRLGKAAIEIVGKTNEKFIPEETLCAPRTVAEAVGLKILRRTVKNQGHNRLLPHQNRHDYEYKLRTVATMGVVRLFNSLAEARRASSAIEINMKHLTSDKVNEKKQSISKETFLAALRQ